MYSHTQATLSAISGDLFRSQCPLRPNDFVEEQSLQRSLSVESGSKKQEKATVLSAKSLQCQASETWSATLTEKTAVNDQGVCLCLYRALVLLLVCNFQIECRGRGEETVTALYSLCNCPSSMCSLDSAAPVCIVPSPRPTLAEAILSVLSLLFCHWQRPDPLCPGLPPERRRLYPSRLLDWLD